MDKINLWPPQKGWLVKYHPLSEIYEFTGEQNDGGGYNVVRATDKLSSGGLSDHILNSNEWTMYIPVGIKDA